MERLKTQHQQEKLLVLKQADIGFSKKYRPRRDEEVRFVNKRSRLMSTDGLLHLSSQRKVVQVHDEQVSDAIIAVGCETTTSSLQVDNNADFIDENIVGSSDPRTDPQPGLFYDFALQ